MSRNKGLRDDRWYLNIMAPNTKGPKFAWLDPTSIYINGEAFHDLLGIASGMPLGAVIARQSVMTWGRGAIRCRIGSGPPAACRPGCWASKTGAG